ncbi:MAG: hypothetical protein H6736_24795 [Alphaproteobacteria bacterium]|nr:hypothetical protein [Alphaproteobacteria bacterium]
MGLASLGGAAIGTTVVLTSEDHRVRNAAGAGVALAFPGFLGAGVAMTKGARHCSARDARLARLGGWSYLGLGAAPVMLASLVVVGAGESVFGGDGDLADPLVVGLAGLGAMGLATWSSVKLNRAELSLDVRPEAVGLRARGRL